MWKTDVSVSISMAPWLQYGFKLPSVKTTLLTSCVPPPCCKLKLLTARSNKVRLYLWWSTLERLYLICVEIILFHVELTFRQRHPCTIGHDILLWWHLGKQFLLYSSWHAFPCPIVCRKNIPRHGARELGGTPLASSCRRAELVYFRYIGCWTNGQMTPTHLRCGSYPHKTSRKQPSYCAN